MTTPRTVRRAAALAAALLLTLTAALAPAGPAAAQNTGGFVPIAAPVAVPPGHYLDLSTGKVARARSHWPAIRGHLVLTQTWDGHGDRLAYSQSVSTCRNVGNGGLYGYDMRWTVSAIYNDSNYDWWVFKSFNCTGVYAKWLWHTHGFVGDDWDNATLSVRRGAFVSTST
jgi:hypothetical protein